MVNYIQIWLISFTLVVLSYQHEEKNTGIKATEAEANHAPMEEKHKELLKAIENRAKYGRIKEKSGCANIDCMKQYVLEIKARKLKLSKGNETNINISGRATMHKSQDDEDLDVDFDAIIQERRKNSKKIKKKGIHSDTGAMRHKRLSDQHNTDSQCATFSCKVPEGHCVPLEPQEFIGLSKPNHPSAECCPVYKCFFHGYLGVLPLPEQIRTQEQSHGQSHSPANQGNVESNGQFPNQIIQQPMQPNQPPSNVKGDDNDISDFFKKAFFNNNFDAIENKAKNLHEFDIVDQPDNQSNLFKEITPSQEKQPDNKKIEVDNNVSKPLPAVSVIKHENERPKPPPAEHDDEGSVSITSHVKDDGTKIVEGVGTGKADVKVNSGDDDDFDEKEMDEMLREMEEIKNAGLEEIALTKMSFKPKGLIGGVTNLLGGLLGSNNHPSPDPISYKSSSDGDLVGGLLGGNSGYKSSTETKPVKGGLLGGLTNILTGHNSKSPAMEDAKQARATNTPPPVFPKKGGLLKLLG